MNVNKTHLTFIKILRVILVFGLILVGLGPVPVKSIALPSDGPQRTVTLQTKVVRGTCSSATESYAVLVDGYVY